MPAREGILAGIGYHFGSKEVLMFEAFASIEMMAQLDEPMQKRIAAWLEEGRQGLPVVFGQGGSPHLGTLYQALMTGVLVQWIVDPQRAPTGPDLVEALREVANRAGRSPAVRSAPAG